ncbi:hypothetical protein ACHQM5_016003 [Ranunculus cassubicifolius]
MGRGKIEIKRIENTTNRQVTYTKRRNGILKKAKEISILCEAEVSLVIFSCNNKMSEFHSHSLINSLKRYHKLCPGKRLWDAKHEFLHQEIERIENENKSMQIELRHLKGEDINSLQPGELIPIERALDNGITKVRAKLADIPRIMEKNGRMMEEENKLLTFKLMNGLGRDVDHGYPPPQMPFTFRVQPTHPNLQDN